MCVCVCSKPSWPRMISFDKCVCVCVCVVSRLDLGWLVLTSVCVCVRVCVYTTSLVISSNFIITKNILNKILEKIVCV